MQNKQVHTDIGITKGEGAGLGDIFHLNGGCRVQFFVL